MEIRCDRCDDVGHTASFCPYFRGDLESHPDGGRGDTVPHLQRTQITITANDVLVERSQRQPGWWERQRVELSVNDIWFAWDNVG